VPADPPLVVTLLLEAATQARFEAERTALFPPGRTAVGAHVTLFHALPGDLRAVVRDALGEVESLVPVSVEEPRSLGRGVAYALSCPSLEARHRSWQSRWRDRLTRQDAQRWRPHVTVQNKVTPEEARHTLERLRASFMPWTTTGVALRTWRYDGGPWTLLDEVPLARAPDGST
jgi:hypothetical protein